MNKIVPVQLALWAVLGGTLLPQGILNAQEARPTGAPVAEEGAPWSTLSTQQRSALAPLQPLWPSLSPSTKAKWVGVARRMAAMDKTERERIQERMADWARLTPVERGQARLHFQEARQVSAEVRSEQWKRYNELSADEKRQLAARAVPPTATASVSASGRSTRSPFFVSDKPVASKVNTTPAPTTVPKRIAPSVLQAQPGATTTLISTRPQPPVHQPAGMPKIAAAPAPRANITPAVAPISPAATTDEILNR